MKGKGIGIRVLAWKTKELLYPYESSNTQRFFKKNHWNKIIEEENWHELPHKELKSIVKEKTLLKTINEWFKRSRWKKNAFHTRSHAFLEEHTLVQF